MTDATADLASDPPAKASGKKKLIPILAAVALAGGGFASTYLGLWSPSAMLAPKEEATAAVPTVVFVPVPTIELNIPGGGGQSLVLSASIETETAHQAEVAHLMPRILDAFTNFLSGIDPAAYDKRGVLEIIRAELMTRSHYVLGDEAIKDLLITEFRFK